MVIQDRIKSKTFKIKTKAAINPLMSQLLHIG
jgi:hypothetical protein